MTQFQRARTQTHDPDPVETAEWLEALEALTAESGAQRAQFVLAQVQDEARRLGVSTAGLPYSAYRNTIPVAQQPAYPGDLEIEERIISIIRWNALAMVVRAFRKTCVRRSTSRMSRAVRRRFLRPFTTLTSVKRTN